MDQCVYRANECTTLVYLMDASQKATFSLYNGRIFNEYYVEKKRTSDILGFKGVLKILKTSKLNVILIFIFSIYGFC